MEVSQVRKRLTAAIERSRHAAQERRERSAQVQRAYDAFLTGVAIPIARTVASALKAEGYPFTVGTPAGSVRLTLDRGRDDYIDVALDTATDRPQVIGRVNYARGSRTITEERPVKAGASPDEISEEEFLDFVIAALRPWLER